MLDDCGSTWGLAEYILKLTDQGLEFCLLGRRQLRIHVHYRMGCLGERSELLGAGNPLLEQVDMVNLFRSSAAGLLHSVRDRPHSFQNHVGPLPGLQELTGSCRDQNHHTVSRLELPGLGVPVVETLFGMLGCNEVFSDEGHDSLNSFSHPPYVLDEGALGGALAAQTLGGALAAQTLGGRSGSAELDGTSGNDGELDGTSGEAGESLRGAATGGRCLGAGTGGRCLGAGTGGRCLGAGTGGRCLGAGTGRRSESANSHGRPGSADSRRRPGSADSRRRPGSADSRRRPGRADSRRRPGRADSRRRSAALGKRGLSAALGKRGYRAWERNSPWSWLC